MAYVYYEETTYYKPKPEPKEPENPLAMIFGCVFWFVIIAALAKGCNS